MTTHISRTAASCFGILHQLRRVQRSLPRHASVSLVNSFVLTKLDYCNSLLVGLPVKLLNHLQTVINTARLVCRAMKADHITPVLKDLHWLWIQERIQYKLCVIAFKCQHSLASPYLSYHSNGPQTVSEIIVRQRSSYQLLEGHYWVTERFLSLPPGHGTVCRQQSLLRQPCIHPVEPWKPSIHRIFPTIFFTLSAFWANVTCFWLCSLTLQSSDSTSP